MIAVGNRGSKPPVTASQLRRLGHFADHAARVVHVERRLEEQELKARELAALRRLDERLAGVLDTEAMCQSAIREICSLTKAASGHIRILEGSHPFRRLILRGGEGLYARLAPKDITEHSTSGSGICLRDRKEYIVRDAQADQSFQDFIATTMMKHNAQLRQIRSFGCFPMFLRGDDDGERVVGTLNIQSEDSEFFTDHTIELARDVARRLALSVRNVQLYARQSRRARELMALAAAG